MRPGGHTPHRLRPSAMLRTDPAGGGTGRPRLHTRVAASHLPARPDRGGTPRAAEHLTVNLLDNAIRYNVPAGFITVATGTADGRSFLTMLNSGPHIAAEQVARLERPFE